MTNLIRQQGLLSDTINSLTLGEAYKQISGDCPSSIPGQSLDKGGHPHTRRATCTTNEPPIKGCPPLSILHENPFFVWLIENPDSPLALPGKIYLREHDCIHLLLNRGFSLEDEAFVIGFTMGNDLRTKPIHLLVYFLISMYLYPKYYRFTPKNLLSFRLGLNWGRTLQVRNINSFKFQNYWDKKISEIRLELGIVLH